MLKNSLILKLPYENVKANSCAIRVQPDVTRTHSSHKNSVIYSFFVLKVRLNVTPVHQGTLLSRHYVLSSDQAVVGSNPAGGAYMWGVNKHQPLYMGVDGKIIKFRVQSVCNQDHSGGINLIGVVTSSITLAASSCVPGM